MKHSMAEDTNGIINRIEAIERDIASLKLSVLKKWTPTGKRIARLRGIVKDAEITDKDIASAKRSLYGRITV
jgi:hypothetical protein